jgi:hypothetical protein
MVPPYHVLLVSININISISINININISTSMATRGNILRSLLRRASPLPSAL